MPTKWESEAALKGLASGRLKPDTGRTSAEIAASLEDDFQARQVQICKGCESEFKPNRIGNQYCKLCFNDWKEHIKQKAYKKRKGSK